MATLGILGALGGHWGYVHFDLPEAIRKHFTIVPIRRAHFEPDEVLGRCFIDGQMTLAPSAALADTVLATFPFAQNLQTRRVNYNRNRPSP